MAPQTQWRQIGDPPLRTKRQYGGYAARHSARTVAPPTKTRLRSEVRDRRPMSNSCAACRLPALRNLCAGGRGAVPASPSCCVGVFGCGALEMERSLPAGDLLRRDQGVLLSGASWDGSKPLLALMREDKIIYNKVKMKPCVFAASKCRPTLRLAHQAILVSTSKGSASDGSSGAHGQVTA